MEKVCSNDNDDFIEKRKVALLKVPELQHILGQFNISKTGRKNELQERVMSLVRNGTNQKRREIIEKINEISINLKQMPIEMYTRSDVDKLSKKAAETTSNSQHISVKLKKIPFFDHLDVLLESSILIPPNINSGDQIRYFVFNLNDQQAKNIERNRVIQTNSVEYNVQVLLRICLADPTEQNDLFPQNFQLRVNNRICPLPAFLPCRPNTIPKRTCKPLNITPFVKILPGSSNNIEVRWRKEPQKTFAVTCLLVQKISSYKLLQRLKVQAESMTRRMITDKLSIEVDSEIATTMLPVSLICPLGKIRMKMPCRASTCKHLQCFDALLYLQMNEHKQSWICPVCDKEALFENLLIDGYFLNVIERLSVHDNEILLHKDGSWSKHEEKIVQLDNYDGFVISDEEEDTNNNKPTLITNAKPEKIKLRKAGHISKKIKISETISYNTSETIDLTLDD